MRRRKVARLAERSRMCRRCAQSVPEPAFPGEAWVCAECLRQQVPVSIPVVEKGGWERYDTSRVFAGFRVRKVRQGDGPEYETEVVSDAGEFYAYGEAAVALYSKSERWTNTLLKLFPALRCVARGDDGRGVIAMPVPAFPAVAARCRARRKRVVTPERLAQLAKAREKSPIAQKGGESPTPLLLPPKKMKEAPRGATAESLGGLFG